MNSKSRTRATKCLVAAAATLGLMVSTLATAADPAATPAAKPLPTSNAWRLEFDGKADVDGEIVVAIIVGEETTNVTLAVKKGTSEDKAAKLLVKELQAKAPPKKFHFEVDDGEDVMFKKKVGMGVPNFTVQVVSNTATGLKAEMEKE